MLRPSYPAWLVFSASVAKALAPTSRKRRQEAPCILMRHRHTPSHVSCVDEGCQLHYRRLPSISAFQDTFNMFQNQTSEKGRSGAQECLHGHSTINCSGTHCIGPVTSHSPGQQTPQHVDAALRHPFIWKWQQMTLKLKKINITRTLLLIFAHIPCSLFWQNFTSWQT